MSGIISETGFIKNSEKHRTGEELQLIDDNWINSIDKRGSATVYHQSGGYLEGSNQLIESNFGENNTYHQVGKPYSSIEKKYIKDDYIIFRC